MTGCNQNDKVKRNRRSYVCMQVHVLCETQILAIYLVHVITWDTQKKRLSYTLVFGNYSHLSTVILNSMQYDFKPKGRNVFEKLLKKSILTEYQFDT